MKTKPTDIARALVEEVEASPASTDAACVSALQLLKRLCPGFTRRGFTKLVEAEMRRRGQQSSGLLIVPHERIMSPEHVSTLLTKHSGKPISMTEKIDPDIIGGAVLLMDHRRIDCSVQGALRDLLQTCLEPIV